MPSRVHQGLAILLQENPQLLAWLLRHVLGLQLSGDVSLEPAPETIRRLDVPDHYPDGVVAVAGRTADDREAFVTEIQLRKDLMKHYTWAVYVSDTALRLRCPATLVVVTTSKAVERWCADTINLGRGRLLLRPLVLGPSNIPHRIELSLARKIPELAVLMVAMHGHGPESLRITRAAIDAVATLSGHDDRRARLYLQLISIFADQEITGMLTEQMKRNFSRQVEREFADTLRLVEECAAIAQRQQLLERKHRQVRKDALLLVLGARALHPTPEQRAQINACEDDAMMNQWIQRAIGAGDLAEVLDPAD